LKTAVVLKYIKRVNEAYRHWILGTTKLPYMPYQLSIEPTNHCNLQCPKCLQGSNNYPRKRKFMPYSLFEKIMKDNYKHFWKVYLMYGGESLLHPKFPQMIRLCKELGIWQTFLHTNGTLLTEELSYKLIEAGLDNMIISFDGDDKETYEKLQKGANFEKTIENIKTFLKVKKKLGSTKPFTSIKMIQSLVDQSSSVDSGFVKNFEKLPLNLIYFEKLLAQGEYGKKLLKDSRWKVFNYERLEQQNVKDYFTCYNIYSEVVVNCQGKVIRCCMDQECYHEVGDLGREKIKDIWNNKAFMSIRENLQKGIFSGPCKRCFSLWSGSPRHYLIRNLSEYLTFPKYIIRYYYPNVAGRFLSIPIVNKILYTDNLSYY